MDAKLNKIVITPAKFDKEGEIVQDEYATLTVEVPMDSTGQRQAIMGLHDVLDSEFVKVEIQSGQLRMDMGQKPSETPQQEEIPNG